MDPGQGVYQMKPGWKRFGAHFPKEIDHADVPRRDNPDRPKQRKCNENNNEQSDDGSSRIHKPELTPGGSIVSKAFFPLFQCAN